MKTTSNITSNIIGLTGSWGTTLASSFLQNVGLPIPTEGGEVDLLTIISGLAASFLTIALGIKRISEGLAKAKLDTAEARYRTAEARKLELENQQAEKLFATKKEDHE